MVVCARVQDTPLRYASNADVHLAATGGNDLSILIYDIGNRKTCLYKLVGHTDCVGSIVFTGATSLASGADDKLVRLWDLSCEQLMDAGDSSKSNLLGKHESKHAVILSNSHALYGHLQWVLAVRYVPQTPRLWACRSHPHPHQQIRRLVSASSDGIIRVWDLTARVALHVLDVHNGIISALQVICGRFILSSSECDDGEASEVELWDLNTGVCLHKFEGLSGRISSCCANSRMVIAAAPSTVAVWEM